MAERPRCVILAGPNGAGKSTHAALIVQGIYGIATYINPDMIAAGLGAVAVDSVAFDTGRIALGAVNDCIHRRNEFAFETTLSGRRWPRRLDRLRAADHDVLLHYLWIPDANQCVARVAQRVAAGGHGVREVDIRRRHVSSLDNFISLFMPRVHKWHVHDGSNSGGLIAVASGTSHDLARIAEPDAWRRFTEATRKHIVREVASHGYLHTQARETGMDHHEPEAVREGVDAGRDSLMPSPEVIVAASRIAVRRALAIQRALGVAAVSMENGRLVMIPPEELPRDVNDVEWTERQIASRSGSR